MKKSIIYIVIAVLVVWGLYMLLGNQGGPSTTIKVGFIGPLTGDASSIGTVNRAAAEVAADEVNAAGGINGKKLEMIYEDGQCNAQAANNAANKLISVDKVVAIVGGLCSTETGAFGPAAMKAKVIVFSYGSSAPQLNQLGKYFFRSYPSDAFQGKFGAEYAYNTLNARKVAVVYHISEWGTGIKTVFESRFKELGGEIVSEDGAPQDARDYRTIMSKAKNTKADLIYMPTYPDGGAVALKQAYDLAIKTPFLGADGWGDPKLYKAVSGLGSFVFTQPVTPAPADFQAKIKAKTGNNDVPLGTPNAYDNVKILAQVIGKVGTNPDSIAEALHQLSYDGVSGHVAFDATGDLTSANYIVSRIENGTAVEVK